MGVVVIGVRAGAAGHLHVGPGRARSGDRGRSLLGLSFLALEFDRAERILEKAIIWGDDAKDRAEAASPRQKAVAAALAALAVAAFVVAAVLWDIPLLPVV